MKRYTTVYYFLFVLIVMGAFASMAQNSYGLKICGLACLGFVLTFLHEIFFATRAENEPQTPSWLRYVELISLTVIALVFMFRNFSMEFLFGNSLLILASAALLLLLSYQAAVELRTARLKQVSLAYLLALYYGAVLLFIIAFLLVIALPDFAFASAVTALILIAIFVGITLILKNVDVNGETISVWQYAGQLKNKSAILLIASVLVFGYSLLNSAGVLPPLYHGTLPKAYQDIVDQSIKNSDEKWKEKPAEFMDRYEVFLSRHSKN